jgi:hypothetical protein
MKIVTDYKRTSEKREASDETNQITPADIVGNFYETVPSEMSYKFKVSSRAHVANKMDEYGFNKCVIAYIKDDLGAIFIIKSARSHWAFSIRNKIFGRDGYGLSQLELVDAIKFLDNNKNTKVLNQNEYDKLKKLLLVARLSK